MVLQWSIIRWLRQVDRDHWTSCVTSTDLCRAVIWRHLLQTAQTGCWVCRRCRSRPTDQSQGRSLSRHLYDMERTWRSVITNACECSFTNLLCTDWFLGPRKPSAHSTNRCLYCIYFTPFCIKPIHCSWKYSSGILVHFCERFRCHLTPLLSNRHHRSSGDCLEGKGKTIRSVLCNIVCNNCAQCHAHIWTD